MRLSEAIRLGAMLHPQGFYAYKRDMNGVTVTCALGAAVEAGYTMSVASALELGAEFVCPVCGLESQSYSIITDLNDKHRWTREKIADWLESCERQRHMEPELVEPAGVACGE